MHKGSFLLPEIYTVKIYQTKTEHKFEKTIDKYKHMFYAYQQ